MTQPTVSKHWKTIVGQSTRSRANLPGQAPITERCRNYGRDNIILGYIGYTMKTHLIAPALLCCPEHNSKTNDFKVFKLDIDILEVIWFWGWKVKGQGHTVSKCIFHTDDHDAYVNAHVTDNSMSGF